jgi:hypothetical protein
MPYKKQPKYQEQIAMGAGMAGRIYPLICTARAAIATHTMGTPVEGTSGMRIVRPGVHNDTFNAEATAIHFLRPVTTTYGQSVYHFNIDRAADTLGMLCDGNVPYGPIPIHPDVEYVSFFAQSGTGNIAGGWVVPMVHDSLNF